MKDYQPFRTLGKHDTLVNSELCKWQHVWANARAHRYMQKGEEELGVPLHHLQTYSSETAEMLITINLRNSGLK